MEKLVSLIVLSVTEFVLSLFPSQDNSDIKIECRSEDRQRHEKTCNVSAPFMRTKTQVSGSPFSNTAFKVDHTETQFTTMHHTRPFMTTGYHSCS